MSEHINISPSLMTMDLDQFKEQIHFLNDHVDSFHIDIMDGHFVPNLSLSPWFIEQTRKLTNKEMSAHLMVTDPAFWVQQLINIKCEIICMPAEKINGIAFRLIDQIHSAGLKAGVVLNPETPVQEIMPYIDILDKVTIMTVDPGFAGQRFLGHMLEKITELKKLREEQGYHYLIEMDGSTNKEHWKMIHEVKPDIYVIGRSGLFNLADDIQSSWQKMVAEFEEATGETFI
ncbi:D-allulose 6-phosphate 3-epimerase [Celerinatantimonas diazotrophica]|uniref:Putative D-allulose-6-phosphate 3-epimerase n=1 Tax=Celerinatantimonas diazotrophica TaxID=412034 RepID=A0A4R1JA60_9GAMM|nr:D-allulose 6-phosphate 3-epimerase [Celerinatantimonas diazotrophica]TCK47354.1 D-allulose-6-phosphate 3-epimerase [Celerinatantimonas diazotrophica]CAG9295030.1 D-allulose-6-phosphate 3-epimerase [Celerinatantimonas diazotrophica]